MNTLATFQQLTSRAEMIGYRVSKVVFREFHSSDALQAMHDKAIHERTRLRLEADTEDHRQRTLDLQLAKEEERSVKERELEMEREEHRRRMERDRHEEELRLVRDKEEHQLGLQDTQLARSAARAVTEREVARLEGEHRRLLKAETLRLTLDTEQQRSELLVDEKERLENLSSLGADITRVLVAECHVPDKSIKIDT